MDVTIIMPLFNPDRKILQDIDSAIKNQNYSWKIKVLKIDEGLGLADSLNLGITNSRPKLWFLFTRIVFRRRRIG